MAYDWLVDDLLLVGWWTKIDWLLTYNWLVDVLWLVGWCPMIGWLMAYDWLVDDLWLVGRWPMIGWLMSYDWLADGQRFVGWWPMIGWLMSYDWLVDDLWLVGWWPMTDWLMAYDWLVDIKQIFQKSCCLNIDGEDRRAVLSSSPICPFFLQKIFNIAQLKILCESNIFCCFRLILSHLGLTLLVSRSHIISWLVTFD